MASIRAPAGHFTLLYFAAASSYTQKSHDFIEAPLSAGTLFNTLEKMHPGIKEKVLVSCAVTINLDYVDLDDEDVTATAQIIEAGDEVAIIPPVSSG